MAYKNIEDYIKWKESPKGRALILINRYKHLDKKFNRETPDMDADWVIKNILNSKCHYCNCNDSERKLGMDRLDNRIGHIKSNVVPCCRECNNKRQWEEAKDKNNPSTIIRNKNISEGKKGFKHSEISKKKMSESRKGVKLSEEHKKKISIANMGKHNHDYISHEIRKKIAKIISKPCMAKDENGNIVFTFSSTSEAKKLQGFTQSKVSAACRNENNKTNKYKGFYWYFI